MGISAFIYMFVCIEDISHATIGKLNMELPAQHEWKNTSVLYAVTLGRMPMIKNFQRA